MLIPAGYVTTVYDPVYSSRDGKGMCQAPDKPTELQHPGCRSRSCSAPSRAGVRAAEDRLVLEAASRRRIPPPNFGPL